MNEWLVASLGFLTFWLLLFIIKPHVRKQMLWSSLLTTPLGLTEPIFVPEYWQPPSLFNLATRTGFDIESFIFSFALGGIAAVVYEAVLGFRQKKTIEPHTALLHWLALLTPFIIFIPLHMFTSINPIYAVIIAGITGAIATMLCRNDLATPMLTGGFLFLVFYFIGFLLINLTYPNLVAAYWNLSALSGILIIGIPLEELLFAFSIGTLWSGYYEHLGRYSFSSAKSVLQHKRQ